MDYWNIGTFIDRWKIPRSTNGMLSVSNLDFESGRITRRLPSFIQVVRIFIDVPGSGKNIGGCLAEFRFLLSIFFFCLSSKISSSIRFNDQTVISFFWNIIENIVDRLQSAKRHLYIAICKSGAMLNITILRYCNVRSIYKIIVNDLIDLFIKIKIDKITTWIDWSIDNWTGRCSQFSLSIIVLN